MPLSPSELVASGRNANPEGCKLFHTRLGVDQGPRRPTVALWIVDAARAPVGAIPGAALMLGAALEEAVVQPLHALVNLHGAQA